VWSVYVRGHDIGATTGVLPDETPVGLTGEVRVMLETGVLLAAAEGPPKRVLDGVGFVSVISELAWLSAQWDMNGRTVVSLADDIVGDPVEPESYSGWRRLGCLLVTEESVCCLLSLWRSSEQ